MKLICSLSLTHAVPETATPLRHRKGKRTVKAKKACCVKKGKSQSRVYSGMVSFMCLLYVGITQPLFPSTIGTQSHFA